MSPDRRVPTVGLGPGAEFDLIRRVAALAPPQGEHVRLGPGDDGAVVGEGWVLSTDLSVEDVHFRRRWLSDEEIGYRAAAAALSDLAAMAAEPVGVLVSVAYPQGGGFDAEALNRGVHAAAGAVGATVLGGDLSRSPGPVFVDVTVVGRTLEPVLRAGALPGDEVWVTGALGGSAAAVRLWTDGSEPPAALRAAYAHPVPRVGAALALARAGVLHAMVDLSDGLAGDAGHLAAAGGVAVVLREAAIPRAPGLDDALGGEGSREAVLHGGEDYELCFAAPAGAVSPDALSRAAGVALTRVGTVEAGEGVWLEDEAGVRTRVVRGGWDHLSGEGAP